MKIRNNLFVQFDAVQGQVNKECFVYFTDKNNIPYCADIEQLTVGQLVINGKRLVCWKSPLDVAVFQHKTALDVLDTTSGKVYIHHLWTEGNNIPDIATYWIAIKDNKAVSIQGRTDMWRSEDHTYPDWLDSLRQKYSLVAA